MRFTTALFVLALLLMNVAQAETIKTGEWEITRRLEGMPGVLRPILRCVTPEMAQRNETPDLNAFPSCKVLKSKSEDGRYRVKVTCQGSTTKLNVVTNGELTSDKTLSSSTTVTKVTENRRETVRRYETTGKWVRNECTNRQTGILLRERPYGDQLLGLLSKEYPRSDSEWQVREKRRYETLLAQKRVDLLVVPFQVQEFAFGRSTRSLMTAELALALSEIQTETLADPYLVARALGEGRRRIEPADVYRLADELHVKRIIWSYVGHNRHDSMALTIRDQRRLPDSKWPPLKASATKTFEDIKFSDELQPIDVFESMLPDVVRAMGFDGSSLTKPRRVSKATISHFPVSPLPGETKSPEPAQEAYHLQILGALAPYSAEREEERLFERSLLAVSRMSPESPSYRALKGRAYMHLGFRPAALRILTGPKSDEEKEVVAALNGNLSEIESIAAKARSPVVRFFAALDANSLRQAYDLQSRRRSLDDFEALGLSQPSWKYLSRRKFIDTDAWIEHDNLLVKQLLDRDFPIPNFTAEGIISSSLTLGDSDAARTTIDLSVANHVRKVFETEGSTLCCKPFSYRATRLDYLTLLEDIGTANLIDRARLYEDMQGLPQRTLRFLDRIDPVYKGNPTLTLVRAEAQARLAASASETARETLRNSASENVLKSFYWEQGQTYSAGQAWHLIVKLQPRQYGYAGNLYASDFPVRLRYPFWNSASKRDRLREAEKALKYAQSDFTIASYLLGLLDSDEKRETFLNTLEDRFHGSPARTVLIAENRAKRGNRAAAEKDYTAAIKSGSRYWPIYDKLGVMLVEEGKYSKAAEAYLKYPPFHEKLSEKAVETSNYAYSAGSLFYWRGALDQAARLYQIAADLQTGSDASMTSELRLALLEKDYVGAARGSRARAVRYNSGYGYRDYLSLLHLLGYSQQAWDAFMSLIPRVTEPYIWESALVGHRLNGVSESQIIDWAKQDNVRRAGDGTYSFAASYLALAGVTDRMPSKELAAAVAAIDTGVWQVNQSGHSFTVREMPGGKFYMVVGPSRSGGSVARGSPPVAVKSDLVYFVKAYRALRNKDYASANKLLGEATALYDVADEHWAYLLPYYAFAAAKTGDREGINQALDRIPEEKRRFDYYIARGVMAAINGKKQEALTALKDGFNRRVFTGYRPVLPGYEYAEMCEWLYESTGETGYRDLALNWAKKTQRVRPWHAWAYAMEAKLTENQDDRRKALGAALYLDKHSERLKAFSKQERLEAAKAFERSNPFLESKKTEGAQHKSI